MMMTVMGMMIMTMMTITFSIVFDFFWFFHCFLRTHALLFSTIKNQVFVALANGSVGIFCRSEGMTLQIYFEKFILQNWN